MPFKKDWNPSNGLLKRMDRNPLKKASMDFVFFFHLGCGKAPVGAQIALLDQTTKPPRCEVPKERAWQTKKIGTPKKSLNEKDRNP